MPMKLSVYIPKDLEKPLMQRADGSGLSPSRVVQDLVRASLSGQRRTFSDEFMALAGSWEDDKTTEAICQEIDDDQVVAERVEML